MAIPEDQDTHVCTACGRTYSRAKAYTDGYHYLLAPYHYRSGIDEYCLACWLCVGPNDLAGMERESAQA
jgi:hypothetical protein